LILLSSFNDIIVVKHRNERLFRIPQQSCGMRTRRDRATSALLLLLLWQHRECTNSRHWAQYSFIAVQRP